MIERRNAFELMRDQAAEHFERHRIILAATQRIDGQSPRHDLSDDRQPRLPRRQAPGRANSLIPAGPKIAVTGGLDFNDHRLIWAWLDQVHANIPTWCSCTVDRRKGAANASPGRWADHRKVPQIRIQARLDEARESRAVQTQRSDARRPADRRDGLPGTGIQGQPRRQGA